MGEVYRAIDSVLERPVAVKVLSRRYADEPDARARFEREALAAARLSPERHVVTVFDVGVHGGRPFIVMEYVEGGSLHDRLAHGPVSREQALEWLEHVGRALDRAHEHGIVHRDVKPANLLLDSEGNVRVSDFGIASAAGLETVTLPGTVLGTAGYISPEQARGEPTTPASDRYALGVIAFELLTGRRPFEGDTAATQALAHVTAPVPSAVGLKPGLPPDVDAVLARALAKEPVDRPASCAELVADLRDALRQADEVDATLPAVRPAAAETRVSPPPPRTAATRVVSRDDPVRPAARASSTPRRAVVERAPARRAPGRSVLAVAAVSVLAGGLAGFFLLGFGDGGPEAQTPPADPPATTEPERPPPEPSTRAPAVDGVALNAAGFELMGGGQYEEAHPVLRRAVGALLGEQSLDEAFASYNLAFTRFALGRCDGVLGLLDRSERIQGDRSEIDALREDWEDRCAEGDDDEEDSGRVRDDDDDD